VKALPFRAALTILRSIGIVSLLLVVLAAMNRDAVVVGSGSGGSPTTGHASPPSAAHEHQLLGSSSASSLAFEADDYEQDDDPVLGLVLDAPAWSASTLSVGYVRIREATSRATSQADLRAQSPRGPPA